MSVTWPDRSRITLRLNEAPSSANATFFTSRFGTSTRTTNCVELILRASTGLPLPSARPNSRFRARVISINTNGNSQLGLGTAVLTLPLGNTNNLHSVKPASEVWISLGLSKNLAAADAAIGGRPWLVHKGKTITVGTGGSNAQYLQVKHPRTAIGFNSGYLFLVEVDGRQKELSMGMSLLELAAFMKRLGCTEAMNLDGGGSSTFWLKDHVVNSPSDKHERSVANALVITQQKRPITR